MPESASLRIWHGRCNEERMPKGVPLTIQFVHHCRKREGSLDDYAEHLASIASSARAAMLRASESANLFVYVAARDVWTCALARLELLGSYRAREASWTIS